jgi:hypothetical protein
MDQNTAMLADAIASPPTPRPKRRWFRFSLRTLLLFVLLLGSAMGLWFRWEPWVVAHQLDTGGTACAAFSPDDRLIVLSLRVATIAEVATGRTIARLDFDEGDYLDAPMWSRDGHWLWFHTAMGSWPLWDAATWTDAPIAGWDEKDRIFRPTPLGVSLGYGTVDRFPESDERSWVGTGRTSRDGRAVADLPGPAVAVYHGKYDTEADVLTYVRVPPPFIPNCYYSGTISADGNWVAICSDRNRFAYLYWRRRPEYWWGVAWLPEFWLTILFAPAFLWSVRRDRTTL